MQIGWFPQNLRERSLLALGLLISLLLGLYAYKISSLQEIDWDFAFKLEGLHSMQLAFSSQLHGWLSFFYSPAAWLVKAGMLPLHAYRIVHALVFLASIAICAFFCGELFHHWIAAALGALLFALNPGVNDIVTRFDDNLFSYPFLLIALWGYFVLVGMVPGRQTIPKKSKIIILSASFVCSFLLIMLAAANLTVLPLFAFLFGLAVFRWIRADGMAALPWQAIPLALLFIVILWIIHDIVIFRNPNLTLSNLGEMVLSIQVFGMKGIGEASNGRLETFIDPGFKRIAFERLLSFTILGVPPSEGLVEVPAEGKFEFFLNLKAWKENIHPFFPILPALGLALLGFQIFKKEFFLAIVTFGILCFVAFYSNFCIEYFDGLERYDLFVFLLPLIFALFIMSSRRFIWPSIILATMLLLGGTNRLMNRPSCDSVVCRLSAMQIPNNTDTYYFTENEIITTNQWAGLYFLGLHSSKIIERTDPQMIDLFRPFSRVQKEDLNAVEICKAYLLGTTYISADANQLLHCDH